MKEVKIIILRGNGEKTHLTEAIKIGVHGYLIKETDRNSFVNAVKEVIAGKLYYHPSITSD